MAVRQVVVGVEATQANHALAAEVAVGLARGELAGDEDALRLERVVVAVVAHCQAAEDLDHLDARRVLVYHHRHVLRDDHLGDDRVHGHVAVEVGEEDRRARAGPLHSGVVRVVAGHCDGRAARDELHAAERRDIAPGEDGGDLRLDLEARDGQQGAVARDRGVEDLEVREVRLLELRQAVVVVRNVAVAHLVARDAGQVLAPLELPRERNGLVVHRRDLGDGDAYVRGGNVRAIRRLRVHATREHPRQHDGAAQTDHPRNRTTLDRSGD